MSDWEDNFGAGYSAESLISSINHSNRMEDAANRRVFVTRSWSSPELETEELRFNTFDEAEDWRKQNPGRRWTRRPDGSGYIMKVFKNSI